MHVANLKCLYDKRACVQFIDFNTNEHLQRQVNSGSGTRNAQQFENCACKVDARDRANALVAAERTLSPTSSSSELSLCSVQPLRETELIHSYHAK